MEILVLFPAGLLAVANSFAGAFDRQYIPLVAPLALADESSSLILILVRECRSMCDLDNDHVIIELVVVNRQ